MTEVQKLAKVMVLKDMCKEYELLAKYNGGVDYDRWKALEMLIKALSQEPKWIPVSERLPKEKDGAVLVTMPDNTIKTARCSEFSGEWYVGDMMGVGGPDPLAWMPLPEPYKAGRED